MSSPTPEIHTEKIKTFEGILFSFRMIEVVGGTFDMGARDDDPFDSEKPIHQVNVPDFWIGEFPVTQALWQVVLGDNPSYFLGMDRPVEQVSWNDITQRFLPALNERCNQHYRLPTEAEWEYAARGGIYHSPFRYAGSHRLKDVGWYDENSHRETKPVGLKQSNALGLYDMSGNVEEWCEDHFHENYEGAPNDGSAWIDEVSWSWFLSRMIRGGSWSDHLRGLCHVSHRVSYPPENDYPHVGFRLVLSSLQ